MKFATQYTYRNANTDAKQSTTFATYNEEPSLTQQSDMQDADINVMMKRYGLTGQFPTVLQPPLYGDFSDVGDYRSAVQKIREADTAFMELPAKIREEFRNDAGTFMAFAQDPANLPKLKEMGLTRPPEEVTIQTVRIAKEDEK